MIRRSCAFGVVLSLVAAAGCSSSSSSSSGWDMPQYKTPSSVLISADGALDMGYAPRWAADLGLDSDERIVWSYIADDLLLTVTQPSNLVAATRISDGARMWITQLGGDLEKLYGAVRYDGIVYANSGSRVFSIDPYSGEHTGIWPLVEPVTTGPVLDDDKAIFGSVNGTVFAHSFISGRHRWRYLMTAQIDTPPILVGANVFAADHKGTFVMLDSETGDLVWNGRAFGAVSGSPDADRTSIYVPSEDNFLYAVNRATGEDKWKYAAAQPLTEAPAAIGLGVYQPVTGRLIALDAVDGREPRWVLDEPATPVTALRDNLLVTAPKGLMLIEVDTGRVVKRVPTRPVQRVLLGPDDSLILVAPNGRIMRLDPA